MFYLMSHYKFVGVDERCVAVSTQNTLADSFRSGPERYLQLLS